MPAISPARRRAIVAAVLTLLCATIPVQAAAAEPSSTLAVSSSTGWVWPLAAFRLEQPFAAPAHEYGPGHRGVDLRPADGFEVRAPAAGVVAFSGAVAGRGILTVDHGAGLVSTLEPVESDLEAGRPVEAGAVVGRLSVGGHAEPGTLHFGVRLHGDYINPALLLGGVPRAVLLPCC